MIFLTRTSAKILNWREFLMAGYFHGGLETGGKHKAVTAEEKGYNNFDHNMKISLGSELH
jgi:hypothetical protein